MTLNLHCYARRYGRQWHAICTDLDIAADGPSFQDARASLVVCVELYLEGLAELAPSEQQRFLTRRSPWYVRAKMVILTLSHLFRRDERRSRVFVLQSRVPAAA